ncbi:MAG: tRNA pseudouridine(55) synthase TruB [Firmicutes bacterium]|nr:tRNA pseudouridine(55) synthase TruB [Bacillota bacterium]
MPDGRMNGVMELEGFLNLLKPPGMTSHDVVAYVRRLTGTKKVGHAGTLDPAAAGVLLVCLGQATKVAAFLTEQDKSYRGEMILGAATDSQDSSGQVIARREDFAISREEITAVLAEFAGELLQVPPMVSAVKHHGRRLYELARAGEVVERQPRRVTIHRLELVEIVPGPGQPAGEPAEDPTGQTLGKPVEDRYGPGARVIFDVSCSKGTYIRTLCHDLGDRLGCLAHLGFLVRTRTGSFELRESLTLEELTAAVKAGDLAGRLLPLDWALGALPAVVCKPGAAEAARHGAAIYSPGVDRQDDGILPGMQVRVYDPRGAFISVARAREDAAGLSFRPVRVFQSPKQ